MPALLTSTSRPPRSAWAWSVIRRTASASARSAWTTVCPSPGSPARTWPARPGDPRWCTATRSPCPANASATARPRPRDAPVTSTARCATMLPQGLGIAVLRVRVTPARHVVGEPARGVEQGLTQAGVPLHEAGQPPGGQPGHILPDQDLRVAVRAGPDADRRDPQRGRDPPPEIGGDRLEHHGERARVLERTGVREQLIARGAAALDPPYATERVDALRGQPEVPHHRDAGRRHRPDLGEHALPALELDGLRPALLQVPDRVPQRDLGPSLVAAER